MAIPEYKPFDYFYTSTHEFRWRKYLLEKYGLTEGEIIQYEANMVADRNRWHEKNVSFDRWKLFVLIIAAVLTFIGVLVAKWLLCMFLDIEKGSLGMKLISYCGTIVIISIIWVYGARKSLLNGLMHGLNTNTRCELNIMFLLRNTLKTATGSGITNL